MMINESAEKSSLIVGIEIKIVLKNTNLNGEALYLCIKLMR